MGAEPLLAKPPAFNCNTPFTVTLAVPKSNPPVNTVVTLVLITNVPVPLKALAPVIASVAPVTPEVIERLVVVALIFPPLLFKVRVRPFKSNAPAFKICKTSPAVVLMVTSVAGEALKVTLPAALLTTK